MKHYLLISGIYLVASSAIAMEPKLEIVNKITSTQQTDDIIKVKGITDKSPTGTLNVSIKQNTKENSYSGTMKNNGYTSGPQWKSTLSPKDAEEVYKQLK